MGVDAIKGGYAALRAGSSVAAMSAFQSGIQESILYGTQQIKMYANGLGVPQDYVLSHMWLNLAAASGETDGTKLREICERLMTPDQIAEAQRLAREWVAAHPKR